MAKRALEWNDKAVVKANLTALTVTVKDGEESTVSESFELTEIFPNFAQFDEIQRWVIINGVKQKLADSAALSKDTDPTPGEKLEAIQGMWNQITVENQWHKAAAGGGGGPAWVSEKKALLLAYAQGEADPVDVKVAIKFRLVTQAELDKAKKLYETERAKASEEEAVQEAVKAAENNLPKSSEGQVQAKKDTSGKVQTKRRTAGRGDK